MPVPLTADASNVGSGKVAARVGLALTIAGVVGFVASCLVMSQRVGAYYKAEPPSEFVFKPILKRQFPLWGRQVRMVDETLPDGTPALRVEYGDASLILPVHAPVVANLPELGGYAQWLAVATFAPMHQGEVEMDPEKNQAKSFRVVLVKRNAAPGHDDNMGGLVGRKLWTFDIVEFMPDGTLTERRMQFPAIKYGTGKPYLPALEADPEARVEPIAERSWEWQAALLAIPKLHLSNYKFRTTAVGAMGWTLPGAGFSMMGVVAGIALWQGGRIGTRRTRPSGTPQPSASSLAGATRSSR